MIAFLSGLWRGKRHKQRLKIAISGKPKHQVQQAGVRAVFYIVLIIVAHTVAMMSFEGFSYGDSLWLTLTSLTTVGYGDISAATPMGRVSTVMILYVGGIFIVGNMVGDFFDYRSLRQEAMKNGNWSWNKMKDHIIIIGSKDDSEQHLSRLITECEKTKATMGRNIVLVSENFDGGLPSELQDFNIKYLKGRGNSPTTLEKASVENAHIIIILSWEEQDKFSDGYAFDVISRIRESGSDAQIVAECVDDSNRQRLKTAGATMVLRPIRAYPEMIVGGLLNPGAVEILENLFTADGERIVRTNEVREGSWSDIVSEFVRNDRGVPIAYTDVNSGKVITSPPGTASISASALFLLGS